jgi:hypothetical protein
MYQATMVARFKKIIIYTPIASRPIANLTCNEGITADTDVTLKLSKLRWRRIEFTGPKGEEYVCLTNDFSLKPGGSWFLSVTGAGMKKNSLITIRMICPVLKSEKTQ